MSHRNYPQCQWHSQTKLWNTLNVPYSDSLLLVWTDSKLLKHYLIVLATSGSTRFESFEAHQIHLTVLVYKWFKQIQNFRSTSNSCETTLQWWFTSCSKWFETFETHRIHVKLPYSAVLLVLLTDLKLLKHIEFMWNYLAVPVYWYFDQIRSTSWNYPTVLMYYWFEQTQNLKKKLNSCESNL